MTLTTSLNAANLKITESGQGRGRVKKFVGGVGPKIFEGKG